MALIPLLLNDVLDDLDDFHYRRSLDNYYYHPYRLSNVRPWRRKGRRSAVVNAQSSNKGFKTNLDVQQFHPDEITVKVVDNCVLVEGKHEEREDEHGFISRQFQRRYKLPDDVDVDNVTSKLSSDGILTIECPKKVSPSAKERIIPITRSSAPAVTEATESTLQASNGKGDAPDTMEL
ncbi:alpha-crystallin A chain [Anabrus simplex]|uniref:alpha-crystallin A chain n=1 Tax=Anabrus simplex TaxID=316456 RepID=UPI0035A2BBFF